LRHGGHELGWEPAVSWLVALAELVTGMREGSGGPTPPLAENDPGRAGELLSGIGAREHSSSA
jgi:UDP-glucose 4-epimerase